MGSHVVVVIAGTRHNTRPDVAWWLDRWVRRHGDTLFVLGDATGVDAAAFAHCEARGYDKRVVDVDRAIGSPRMFHDRNQRMVDIAGGVGVCLAFTDESSRGTWDCVRRARVAGLVVHVLPLKRKTPPTAEAGEA